MRNLIRCLEEGARRTLLEGRHVTLLDTAVVASRDRSGQGPGISSYFSSPLVTDPPWLFRELSGIRSACEDAGQDLSAESVEVIRAAIRRHGRDFRLWALSWPALMLKNNGDVCIEPEQFVCRSIMDEGTISRVERRMHRVKQGMERILGHLKRE